ncbi:MAG: helix-turn-helix transcriptional regulator [Comamonas thiooxydans]
MDEGKVMGAIGTRLKEERQRLRLTQQTIADLTLVTKVTQIKYELGTTMPNASYLALFAKEGADVLYILTGRHTPEVRQIDKGTVVLEAEEAALLDNYRSATPTGQATIRQVGVALTELVAKRGQSGKR